MSAAALLAELRGSGLELCAWRGRLLCRPPERLTPELGDRLRAHRGALLELLGPKPPPEVHGDAARRQRPPGPFALLPAGATPDAPPSGWTYLRRGPLAGCWVGPDGELDSGQGGAR